MIRPLRARHRASMFGLAVGLPLLFWAGLLARHSPLEAAPGERSSCLEPEWEEQHLWGDLPITTRLGRSTNAPERTVCELLAREPLRQPNLLVYWSPAALPAPTSPVSLDPQAFLLGAWGDGPACFELPAAFAADPGHLLLFSLAHGEVSGAASLVPLGAGEAR